MENIEIDWIMVCNDVSFHGTKTVKSGQKIMTVNELSREVAFLRKEKMIDRFNEYIFNDILALDDGVYKWNENQFKKLAGTYDSVSPPKPLKSLRL